ncbi:YggS family pyridoxal phosphate-dependent enzyme [Rosenbergiella epipactidis]|uniref:YggS family pyridoxal phosphate-dependent enzyme n=1 Tax=Rosenbergiella epipactidis TaxID=1544694 RepID=UPI001BDB57F5|nr:YggS family pyridoxal phosphate-dependent enzyme [Rosenbergiella epipactidis]MBT0718337.1 YggS family pyridoxal phosphate-dependent enzyme [Rosenbergiella epipactidis]
MTSISQNLHSVEQRIADTAQHCGRSSQEITLLAVSKTKPESDIVAAYHAGQRGFGENYVQEGVSKITALAHLSDIDWHFIGPLQSNKSRLVAEHFAWCHTVDRLKLAQRLSAQRPEHLPPLNVLIQVNISDESSKSGIQVEELNELAAAIYQLPQLRLRGIMAIPAPEPDYPRQLAVCQRMAKLYHALAEHYPEVDTLSLGMSDDLDAAITAGSTLVRVGSAIFGARQYPTTSE